MLKNNEKCIVRALSPQNNIGSLRLGMINKLPTRDIGQQKHEKKLITPRFIQKNKANIQFLDNLNHRRTNTIE